jgi:hypothetical protein
VFPSLTVIVFAWHCPVASIEAVVVCKFLFFSWWNEGSTTGIPAGDAGALVDEETVWRIAGVLDTPLEVRNIDFMLILLVIPMLLFAGLKTVANRLLFGWIKRR